MTDSPDPQGQPEPWQVALAEAHADAETGSRRLSILWLEKRDALLALIQKHYQPSAREERLAEILRRLLAYTESCEGLLNASPAGQVLAARKALEEK